MSEQNSKLFALEPSHLEGGKKYFGQGADFVMGVAQLPQLPETDMPEIAFAGRSNVGKSSLLNAVLGRRQLARTSNTPGRTQEMNFFRAGPDNSPIHIVDLPGYGYAKVSKSKVKDWTRMLSLYLKGRVQLRLACLLVDARHGIKDNDAEMMRMLDQAAVPYQVVLTKADKLKKAERAPLIEITTQRLKEFPAAFPLPILTSSEDKTGIDLLKARLYKILADENRS